MDPFTTRCLSCQRPAHDAGGLCRVCGGKTFVVFQKGEWGVILPEIPSQAFREDVKKRMRLFFDGVDEERLEAELARGGAYVAGDLPQENALALAESFGDLRVEAVAIKGRPRQGELFKNIFHPLPILAGLGVGAALIAMPGLLALDITGAGTATLVAALAKGLMKKKSHGQWSPAPPLPGLIQDDVAEAQRIAPELGDDDRKELGRALSLAVEVLMRLDEDGLLAVTVGSSETIGESLESLLAELVKTARQRVVATGDAAAHLSVTLKNLADAAQLASDELRQTERVLTGQDDLFAEIADRLRLARETADEMRELDAGTEP
jgi:hypothetical protein